MDSELARNVVIGTILGPFLGAIPEGLAAARHYSTPPEYQTEHPDQAADNGDIPCITHKTSTGREKYRITATGIRSRRFLTSWAVARESKEQVELRDVIGN